MWGVFIGVIPGRRDPRGDSCEGLLVFRVSCTWVPGVSLSGALKTQNIILPCLPPPLPHPGVQLGVLCGARGFRCPAQHRRVGVGVLS